MQIIYGQLGIFWGKRRYFEANLHIGVSSFQGARSATTRARFALAFSIKWPEKIGFEFDPTLLFPFLVFIFFLHVLRFSHRGFFKSCVLHFSNLDFFFSIQPPPAGGKMAIKSPSSNFVSRPFRLLICFPFFSMAK